MPDKDIGLSDAMKQKLDRRMDAHKN